LGSERLKMLVDLFSPSRSLRMTMGTEIMAEERALDELTQQQYKLLAYLRNHPRAAIQGCAGSGKTMIAVEQARRLAAQGCRVLFVCFNKALPARLKDHPSLVNKVDVYHFHGLCEAMAEKAGITIPLLPESDSSDYFNRVLPELLADATEEIGPQYDAIVVDEGQDMRDEWWISLEFLLRAESGFFYVFYDPSQNLYGRIVEPPEGMARFPLSENCRNTRKIHKTVAAYYSGEDEITSNAPAGRDPEVVFYGSARELHTGLATILQRLTFDEDIRPQDIVILTQRKVERTALRDKETIGKWKLTQQWPPAANEIYTTTIYQFKGLESPVVILAEISESQNQNLETLLYVGCSRAKNHLVLLAPEEMRNRLGEHLEFSQNPGSSRSSVGIKREKR
jgi:superfamily I DNA/RNA helicase